MISKLKNLFKASLKSTSTVTINGVKYTGRNIVIDGNNNMTIDGVSIMVDDKIVNITIEGDADSVETMSGDITLNNANTVSSVSGDINCNAVSGSVSSVSGDITSKSIIGPVSTLSGDINK